MSLRPILSIWLDTKALSRIRAAEQCSASRGFFCFFLERGELRVVAWSLEMSKTQALAALSAVGFAAFRGTLDTVTPLKVSLASNALNLLLEDVLSAELQNTLKLDEFYKLMHIEEVPFLTQCELFVN